MDTGTYYGAMTNGARIRILKKTPACTQELFSLWQKPPITYPSSFGHHLESKAETPLSRPEGADKYAPWTFSRFVESPMASKVWANEIPGSTVLIGLIKVLYISFCTFCVLLTIRHGGRQLACGGVQ